MNKAENAVIRYQIDLERYKNGQANEILKLLDKANAEVAKYIKQTKGVATKARYKEINKKLKEIAEALKEKVETGTDIDGIINAELHKQEKILGLAQQYIKDVEGGRVDFLYPSVEQIKTSALFKPIDTKYGLTFQSYLESIATGLYNTWDSAIRTGYLTGMTTQQIVKNVLGSASQVGKLTQTGTMQALRNSVYANTRTALQSFANETRNRVYDENEEYFGEEGGYKYKYLATLDSRTCLVCGELDGKLFKHIEDAPMLPQHRGCRCVLVPYFNIEGDKRASKDGYVGSKVTFEKWLDDQDEKTQREVLGATRYKLFKDGTPMKEFVDNGEILTLDQLRKKGVL